MKKQKGGIMATKTKESISEKQAAGFFWRMFEMNAVPMAIWDFNGHFKDANQALLDLLGYTRKEFDEGKINWRDITPEKYRSLDEKCIQQLKSKATAAPFEKEYKRKDGSLVKVRLYNALLDPSDNSGVGIIIHVNSKNN